MARSQLCQPLQGGWTWRVSDAFPGRLLLVLVPLPQPANTPCWFEGGLGAQLCPEGVGSGQLCWGLPLYLHWVREE